MRRLSRHGRGSGMAENSRIEWCDHTFNPWLGCTKVSPACDNCYAESWAKRTGQAHLWNGERRRTSEANWRQPLKWNREAEASGIRRKVFCASLADVFDNQVPEKWRADMWATITITPNLDWLLLTKRPQNIPKMLPIMWGDGWPNVWLGTTAENQEEADRRIPHLLKVPARVHFLSCEPLLGPVNLDGWLPGETSCQSCDDGEGTAAARCTRADIPRDEQCPLNRSVYEYIEGPLDNEGTPQWITCSRATIDWVIGGGESGPKARPWSIQWARSLREQ